MEKQDSFEISSSGSYWIERTNNVTELELKCSSQPGIVNTSFSMHASVSCIVLHNSDAFHTSNLASVYHTGRFPVHTPPVWHSIHTGVRVPVWCSIHTGVRRVPAHVCPPCHNSGCMPRYGVLPNSQSQVKVNKGECKLYHV